MQKNRSREPYPSIGVHKHVQHPVVRRAMHQKKKKNKKRNETTATPFSNDSRRAPRSRISADDPISHEGPSLSVTSNAIIAHNFSPLPWSSPMFTLTSQARRPGSSRSGSIVYTTEYVYYTYIYVYTYIYIHVYVRVTRTKTRERNEIGTRSVFEGLRGESLVVVEQAPRAQYPRKLIAPGERVFRHSALARR